MKNTAHTHTASTPTEAAAAVFVAIGILIVGFGNGHFAGRSGLLVLAVGLAGGVLVLFTRLQYNPKANGHKH